MTLTASLPAAKAGKIGDRLDVLEAERLILTIELRNELLRHAKKMLPDALRQARGKKGKPGSPALLRLIARLAMRNTQIEKPARSGPR
jgi:hypothetical protein